MPQMKAAAVLLFFSCAAHAHYGDPNKLIGGCMKDEVKIRINGIAGDLCSPPCSDSGTCPTDVPTGVTAKPECKLKDQSGDQYCCLICSASLDEQALRAGDAQCGAKASCKAAPSHSKANGMGICTYDDVPQPPSSEHWVPVPSPTFEEQSACISVAFDKTGTVGFAGAGANGIGATVIKSVDAGVTWNIIWPANKSKHAFNIFLAAATASPTNAVVSGAIFDTYTTDGNQFKLSLNGILSPAQDAAIMPNGDFAFITQHAGGKNAVATSKNGNIWTLHGLNEVVNSSWFGGRYGAFPTENTWYVTAGNFPTNNNNDPQSKKRSLTRSVHIDAEDMRMEFSFNDTLGDGPVDCKVDPMNCYSAAIVKTTDAGKTWQVVYENVNKGDNIYPNGIHCSSETHCVAVVEGDTARILLTTDGGKTWSESMHDTDSKSSLVAVHMLSETEVWVSGGHMASLDFEGRYWHSLDGGKTFTKEAIKGLYIFSFDMQSKASGFSVALTAQSGVQLLKYRTNSTTSVALASVVGKIGDQCTGSKGDPQGSCGSNQFCKYWQKAPGNTCQGCYNCKCMSGGPGSTDDPKKCIDSKGNWCPSVKEC